jgi:hypothetical protein
VEADLERFLALVRRELGADDVRLLDVPDEAPGSARGDVPETEGGAAPPDPCELRCRLPDGRWLGARFAAAPPDADLKQRRLEILVGTFDVVVEADSSSPRSSRPPVADVLHDELEALRERAGALNAIVIDANSPVEWGAAHPQEVIPLEPRTPAAARGEDGRDVELSAAVASRRALNTVRNLPELGALRRGKHARYVERAGEVPFIAHSFAGIYLLVVVFDAPFDELRAERAIQDSLPRIERLVLALPPLDPRPYAGVAALRRPRRR